MFTKKFFVVLGIVAFLILVLLTSLCITVLGPLEYGLEYDQNVYTVDKDTLYTGGRHFQGLGFTFIKFPRSQQHIIFSDFVKSEIQAKQANFKDLLEKPEDILPTLIVRSREGLTIQLSVAIYYKLTTSNDEKTKANQLFEIYQNFGDNWDKFVLKLVRSEVRDTTSQFEAFDFFGSRDTIIKGITDNLNQTMREYYFSLQSVFILNVAFPKAFEDAIMQTEIVVQQTEGMTYKKETVQIQANTSILAAGYDKDILSDKETTFAQIDYLLKQSQANATNITLKIKSDALMQIKNNLGFIDQENNSSASKILAYLWIYTMKNNGSPQSTIGISQPQMVQTLTS